MFSYADPSQSTTGLSRHDLDQLVRVHSGRLANFLRRRVGNPHDVEDLVQDTLLEAVRCVDQFQGQSRPETWLFGIAMNLMRNYYKRARQRDICVSAEPDDMASEAADDPLEIAQHRELADRVARLLPALSRDHQQLLHLVVWDDLSYEEAATQLSIPIGTVRSRVSRARSFLRSQIERGGRALDCRACPTPEN
jgi:RNA polymerase sigma factor (sigma-70 family)